MGAAYSEIYHLLQEDPEIRSIIDDNKILTGDDVRPTDAGYEFEVPPKGRHCMLLAQLFVKLGFNNISVGEDAALEERWWDEELANAWKTIQEVHQAELIDGVVEREILSKVLVAPESFPILKATMADEFERKEELSLDEETVEERRRQKAMAEEEAADHGSSRHKPSMEALCKRYHFTMARMHWLHQLFESYLQGD